MSKLFVLLTTALNSILSMEFKCKTGYFINSWTNEDWFCIEMYPVILIYLSIKHSQIPLISPTYLAEELTTEWLVQTHSHAKVLDKVWGVIACLHWEHSSYVFLVADFHKASKNVIYWNCWHCQIQMKLARSYEWVIPRETNIPFQKKWS